MDPNRTIVSGGPAGAPLGQTQAMTPMAGAGFDPQKTSAMTATQMGLGPAVSAVVTASREAAMANGPAREQYLLEIVAGGTPGLSAAAGARTPMNLCLVLDKSGSMEGAPLEYAKQACQYVVDMLTPNDVLSIVTFEEVVEVLMPPQRVTNKQMIKDGIARLDVGNTTNLYDGITLALQQVLSVSDPGRATRLVVLSDGDPTAGIKDFSALVNHAGEVKARGVTITFLGFGPDYNEELLASMAKKAGGNYYYIAQPQLLPEVFRTELEKLMTVVAQNLSLELKLSRWVTMRGPQQANTGTVTIPLADLERGATMEQVLDFEFPNHPLGWYHVAAGKLRYDDCTTGRQETIDIDLVMEFTSDAARYSAPVNPRVAQAAQVQAASRVVEQTIMGLKTGALTQMGALQELQKTQMMLTQQGRMSEAQEVTVAMRALQAGDAGGAEKTLMGTVLNLDQGKK